MSGEEEEKILGEDFSLSSFPLTYGTCSSEWLEEQEASVTHKNSCHILTKFWQRENQI